ncbi:hypothetical protein QJS04_geneDACA015103 [Acorus gramineus]|uniref:Mitochondrial transcription termination factor family protein n=1 Tax=Acorus gramineus TaxID=55184 RepID=A0AAV9BR54_ACOGR|nr:hypothetical protein QJS04_geneDACA015103 [Acorus gramineus]
MFHLVCRNLIDIVNGRGSIETHLRFLQSPSLKLISTISNGDKTSKTSDLTVSYFMNSFGLSLDSALKASKSVRIKTTENADSVLLLLKNQGFTNTQIAKIVSTYPRLVLSNPDKILKPKMDFLRDAGFSNPDLTRIISSNPRILNSSLEKRILPAIGFLKGILRSNKDIISTIKGSTWALTSNLHELMGPKIAVLRDHGMPHYRISMMIKHRARAFLYGSDRFNEALMIIEKMGIDPSSSVFYFAIASVVCTEKSKWEEKMELYKSFGWSEDDIISAFKRQPQIMVISKEKMARMMDFFVNESMWGLSTISSSPELLMFSLEKTIIPRNSVICVLLSNGLLKGNVNFYTICHLKEAKFLEAYVIKYQEKVPQVMQAYQGKA